MARIRGRRAVATASAEGLVELRPMAPESAPCTRPGAPKDPPPLAQAGAPADWRGEKMASFERSGCVEQIGKVKRAGEHVDPTLRRARPLLRRSIPIQLDA